MRVWDDDGERGPNGERPGAGGYGSYGGPPQSQPPRGPTPGYPMYVAPKTNVLAVVSLIFGLLWLFWIGSVVAVITGHMARAQIALSGGRETGDGLAVAGLVLGYIGVVPIALIIVAVVIS